MNASAQPTGCDGRGWLAAQAACACAVIAAGFLAVPVSGADWSLGDDAAAPQAGEVLIADKAVGTSAIQILDAGARIIAEDENAPMPGGLPPELVLGDADTGMQHHAAPGMMADGIVEEPLAGHMVSDGLCPPARRFQRWSAQIDALLLWQTNIPSRSLFVVDNTDQTVLNANQAVPSVSAAPRYALLYHRDPCHAFEINYFQIQSFAGNAAVGPVPGVNYAPDNLPGALFGDLFSAQMATSAGLKSWEFNLRRGQGGLVTWLAGFRWVEWNQQLGILDVNSLAEGFDGYLVETGNNLYGGQLGADLLLWNAYGKIKAKGLAKGGVYYNHQASQSTSVFGDQAALILPPDSTTLGATKDTVAFVGEVALVGEYKLTDWLSWRAGYTLFWLGGIATPTSQLSLSDFTAQTTSVNTYSSAFLHGVTTGLEARW